MCSISDVLNIQIMLYSDSVTRLGDLLKFGQLFKAIGNNYLTFLGNFCKGVKMYHFSSEIIFGRFFLDTLPLSKSLGSYFIKYSEPCVVHIL